MCPPSISLPNCARAKLGHNGQLPIRRVRWVNLFWQPSEWEKRCFPDQQTLLIIRVISYNVSIVLAAICGHCWAGQQSSCRENEGCMARGHSSPGS